MYLSLKLDSILVWFLQVGIIFCRDSDWG